MTDDEVLRFFDGREAALPLFESLEQHIYERFPNTRRRVQKTQITFYNRHVFACASFQRVRRKAELPNPYLVVTLGLAYPLDSARIVIGHVEDIDDELLGLLDEACAFADAK